MMYPSFTVGRRQSQTLNEVDDDQAEQDKHDLLYAINQLESLILASELEHHDLKEEKGVPSLESSGKISPFVRIERTFSRTSSASPSPRTVSATPAGTVQEEEVDAGLNKLVSYLKYSDRYDVIIIAW